MSNRVRRADAEALFAGRPIAADQPRPVLASILDGRRPLRTVAEPTTATPAHAASWLGSHRWPRPVAAALAIGTLLFSGLAVAGAARERGRRCEPGLGPPAAVRPGSGPRPHVAADRPRPDRE
jgi:hypothetical protein